MNTDPSTNTDMVDPGQTSGTETAEQDLLTAHAYAADILQDSKLVERSVSHAGTLSRLATSMEREPLEPSAFGVAQIAIESIYNDFGVQSKLVTKPAGKYTTKHVLAMESMEEVRTVLKRIWVWLINLLERMALFVVEFTKSLFDANDKYVHKAVLLTNRLRKVTTEYSGEVQGTFIRGLTTDSRFEKPAAIEFIREIGTVVRSVVEVSQLPRIWLDLDMVAAVRSQTAYDAYTINPYYGSNTEKRVASTMRQVPEGMEWVDFSDVRLPMGKQMVFLAPIRSFQGDDAYRMAAKITFEFVEERTSIAPDQVPVLTLAETRDVLKFVEVNARETTKTRNEIYKLRSALLQATREARMAAALKELDPEAAKRSEAIRDCYSAVVNSCVRAVTMILKESSFVLRAGLEYAETSLLQHEKLSLQSTQPQTNPQGATP